MLKYYWKRFINLVLNFPPLSDYWYQAAVASVRFTFHYSQLGPELSRPAHVTLFSICAHFCGLQKLRNTQAPTTLDRKDTSSPNRHVPS